MDKDRLNGSGYIDPTAFVALSHVTHEEKQKLDDEANALIREVKELIRSHGFDVVGRIGIIGTKTGKKFL